jgi:two-component system chemotaxis sensor kinase CheA
VHVIRNAVDHGIEPRDVRRTLGKSEVGVIRISATLQGGEFTVAVEDDGGGIPWERIAERARERGLPHATHAELVRALAAQGLSTKDAVTEISGRGVGIGAVFEACERLGGTVAVESRAGAGTRMEFRFPLHAVGPSWVPPRAA